MMRPALQTPLVQPRHPSGPTKSIWNNPPIKVDLTGNHLVEMFHALAGTLLPGQSVFPLMRVEDIPLAVKHHEGLSIAPREVGDVDLYFRHAQLAALLKKVEYPLFEDACKAAAMKKWRESEAACLEMNRKCADILVHPHSTKHVELRDLVVAVRAELETLLGREPPSLDDLAGYCGYGPGADATHCRTEGHAAYKQLMPSALDSQNLERLHSVFPSVMVLGGDPLTVALTGRGSGICSYSDARLEFVPKSCTEHRTIEIMPSLATFEAKGYDAYMRKRLKSVWGVDLRYQTPNRHLAFLGSLSDSENSPVTLDLSSASDRISMGLVRLILPVQWSRALFPLRSRTVTLPDGTSVELQKFASMGNSLTFSLQTAIYGAIIVHAYRAAGLRWKKWRAYGDDLIVVKSIANRVITDLELFGFKLNLDKSFIKGPFRESCGHDYLQGHYVRPFYIKKPIVTVSDVFKYTNLLQTTAVRSPIPVSSFRGLFDYLLKLVPRQLRIVGHPAYGLATLIWSPISVVPKRILKERVSTLKIPDWVAYRTVLLNGCPDSRLESVGTTSQISLVKSPEVFTPSLLKKWRGQVSLERSSRTIISVRESEPSEIPDGVTTLVLRRPGKPGLSPLTDDEIKSLLVPYW